jgi:hypothetical protein
VDPAQRPCRAVLPGRRRAGDHRGVPGELRVRPHPRARAGLAYDIRVTRETPKATAVVWESPTAFTRVQVEKDEEDGHVTACRLSLSGRETAVAAALSPKERAAFAQALETAIWRAKRGEQLA